VTLWSIPRQAYVSPSPNPQASQVRRTRFLRVNKPPNNPTTRGHTPAIFPIPPRRPLKGSRHVFLDHGPANHECDRGLTARYATSNSAHVETLTGPTEDNYESTFLEPPDTPAHQFAVNAFKHAIFGTPAPEDANNGAKAMDKRARVDAANAKNIILTPPNEEEPPLSPSKQLGGILMTPGTASKGRKTVSFGSQVMDNEDKRGNIGKSGIPNDCPGKFPSPWTPGTALKLEPGSDKRPRTKLTEALLDARTTTQPKSGQKPKAKDDSDITIDLGAPRSESGKYWKEQYENYAERSEKEMKKVIAKQQLAKKFAMKKDGEVTELSTKFELERKKFRQRERELEQQNKDYQERLRKALADNTSATIETAALKGRVAVLEGMIATSPTAVHAKSPFQIFEDTSKAAAHVASQQEQREEEYLAPSNSMASSEKENIPNHRRHRRQMGPDTSVRTSAPSLKLGTGEGEASTIIGKSPRVPVTSSKTPLEMVPTPVVPEQLSRSPLKTRRIEPITENAYTLADTIPPSSPLPMPSPGIDIDPWMDLNNESSIPQMDKMAMPNYSAQPFTRAAWNPPPKQIRAAKPVSHAKHIAPSKHADRSAEKPADWNLDAEISGNRSKMTDRSMRCEKTQHDAVASSGTESRRVNVARVEAPKVAEAASLHSPTDPKFDLSKITAHHAEGSSQVKKDRADILPLDRKELAKRRLEERKKLRKNTPT
jgi:hypothetical protein